MRITGLPLMVASMPPDGFDFVVVGSGPNGLVAALTLARAGAMVLNIEASDTPGGGCRSAELTAPGYLSDICSAIHPMAVVSPAFADLDLAKNGVRFAFSDLVLAHPLPDGQVATLRRSVDATSEGLGADGRAWRKLFQPFLKTEFIRSILHPVWSDLEMPWLKLRFGLVALQSCERLANRHFKTPAARALFAGCAAHSTVALDRAGTASFGMVLALAGHLAGWPCIIGGSQSLTSMLLREFGKCGGQIETGKRVRHLRDLPLSKAVLFDLNPRQVAEICGQDLPARYRKHLLRFKHGPGIFKVDWALNGPIPWNNPECHRAATVHACGSYEEVIRAEAEVACGVAPAKPFVLVAQQSLIDPTRAPAGKHVGWAYCHVPSNCQEDMTARIEAQIERFAPGFRDLILARHTISPAQLEQHNPAMLGGDIAGGANDLRQFVFRPVPRWNPYSTPNPRLYICSSSTPPGGGVHGMCGYLAAKAVLRKWS